jgi:hypothetical protein
MFAGIFGLVMGQYSQTQSNDKWEKIGEKTVDLNQDQGIFNWNTDREETVNANDQYSAIKFKVKDATVNLTNVEVVYENGKKQDLTLNKAIQANSESKTITLDNQEKLDKITFNFGKGQSATADKANIEVWGMKAGSSGMNETRSDMSDDR